MTLHDTACTTHGDDQLVTHIEKCPPEWTCAAPEGRPPRARVACSSTGWLANERAQSPKPCATTGGMQLHSDGLPALQEARKEGALYSVT